MTGQNLPSQLTIVIPTYNRREVLQRALTGYLAQSSPQLIEELLVVDDGSTDDTQSVVAESQRAAPFKIRYLNQPNRGPAAARNLGLAEATTRVVLYADDDIIPSRNLVDQHLQWHRRYPKPNEAVLGFVTWSPEVHATPFMKWYSEAGALFGFGQFQHRWELGFREFYTCNISVKKEFLQTFGTFDENFKMAAYEDIELGFRLSKVGLRLLYNRDAIGYHHQFFTFADACRKKRNTASARQLFLQTEAGKHVLGIRHERDSRLSLRILKRLVSLFGAMVHPETKLLDSDFPLPGIIYRSLLWYHAGGA